ncbi:MAG TPA: SLC13 family permease [Methanospirillum sp.]|uniref:SLC13 family permease n=1 Tax=Methanospirillum sp. TaxID=45200 RepID=UPI002CF1AA51|nr:SLC13 family permease [Methanospirillum sp.]HOJ95793.1 SLC13 family permease [Methanospirillum sp.]
MCCIIFQIREYHIPSGTSTITQFALGILGLVFILIAIRQVGRFSFRIWQVMLAGAVLTLLTGQISPHDALHAINPGVMLFLLGMFIIGEGVKNSGLLEDCITGICRYATSGDMLLILIVVTMGGLSAILMNDTIAIIGAPLILILAGRFGVSKPGAMIALCFAVTTGSVFSPIGNPQNYLIASYVPHMSPYLLFLSGLCIPTLLSMGIICLFLRPLFQGAGRPDDGCLIQKTSADIRRGAVYLSFILIFIGIGLQIAHGLMGIGWAVPIEYIAIIAAMPVLLCSSDRISVLKNLDWCTLIFFASMFVLMQSVYDTGFFQGFLPKTGGTDILIVLVFGILLSQFISNVPFVALFQPVLLTPEVSPSIVLALAAGSTIAGNLTILGAASNVIILAQAERYGVHVPMTIFCRYGIPVTICQTCIYAAYLTVMP